MTGQNQTAARRAFLKRQTKRLAAEAPPASFQPTQEEKMKNSTINALLVIVAVLALGVLCLGVLAPLFGRTLFSQPKMGYAPLIDNSNPKIYAQPQNSGQMSTDGKIIYAQSGKPNEQTVTGYVGDGQAIVCTAYRMSFQGEVLDNGVVLAFDGFFNLNKDPITIVDGACTLVSTSATQAKLDSMWVDFCRGDKNESTGWWSYQPWALSYVNVGNYTFPANTSGCFKESGDSYPSFLTRPATTDTVHERITTGVTGTMSFVAGSTVCGEKIVIDGKTYTGCVKNAPAGKVTNGVIWPWDSEIHNLKDLGK